MLRLRKTKVAKEVLYSVKRAIKIRDVNVDNIAISKLFETKSSSKYLMRQLNEVIRPLVLTLPKISRYVKTFKNKVRDKIRIIE